MTISSNIVTDFTDKQAIKVITGLNNFKIQQIKQMTQASEIAGATYMDIAADINIIEEIGSTSTIPICVSAITAEELVNCQQAGVQILEVGNYDAFYEQGRLFSSREIMEISQNIREVLPEITLCVTIPHILYIEEQIKLTQDLQNIGVDIIQTEGKSTSFSKQGDLSGIIQKSASTCSSTYAISKNSSIPIISASGISALTSPISFLYGASCIGISTNIKRLNNVASMVMYIYEIKTAIEYNRGVRKDINHSIRKSSINCQLGSYDLRMESHV